MAKFFKDPDGKLIAALGNDVESTCPSSRASATVT